MTDLKRIIKEPCSKKSSRSCRNSPAALQFHWNKKKKNAGLIFVFIMLIQHTAAYISCPAKKYSKYIGSTGTNPCRLLTSIRQQQENRPTTHNPLWRILCNDNYACYNCHASCANCLEDTGLCDQCEPGYVLKTLSSFSCSTCDSTCETCETNPQFCITCQPQLVLLPVPGQCLNSCPITY